MALIVQQSGFKINGEEREAGYIIPKPIENSNSWAGHINSGRVIVVPDEIVEGTGIDLSKNDQPDIDLSKSLDELKEDVKDITSIEYLDGLNARESKKQDRKGFYRLLVERRKELRDG